MDFCNKLQCLSDPSLMFVAKALPTNIRLGSKDLLGTSTVAYYRNPYITTIKSFIVSKV
jgi:hypothetical protein